MIYALANRMPQTAALSNPIHSCLLKTINPTLNAGQFLGIFDNQI